MSLHSLLKFLAQSLFKVAMLITTFMAEKWRKNFLLKPSLTRNSSPQSVVIVWSQNNLFRVYSLGAWFRKNKKLPHISFILRISFSGISFLKRKNPPDFFFFFNLNHDPITLQTEVFQASAGKTISFLVLKNPNYLFLPLSLTTSSLSKQKKKKKMKKLKICFKNKRRCSESY